ncbi:unnamed protein product [Diabrotica balteata]|uniref:Gustatory receptor n=1 Tax=Diabrotica balteata TaxID=107213 RepID=A0A9N9TBD2_DIABA|nr:unnamed protein product [Diabrotica balteata]
MEVSTFEELYEDELKTIGFKKFIRSARAQGIAKRAHLDSSDGQVIDDHDQFYRDHKLLLALFRILGVMPIQRGKIGKITFGWLSGPMIYAYVFYVVTTVMVLLVGYERVDILLNKSKKFDEYIYSIIFIIFLVPHFWIPFVGWGVAKEVCDYKNGWGFYQLHYYKIVGRNLKFPHLSTLIVIISLGCLIVAVMLLLTLSALLDGFTLYHTTAYFHIITMINMNCALWYINCRAIGNASHALADSFQEDIDQHCSAYMIANYRILWLELSELLQAIGNAYARTYATYSLFMITNITVAIELFLTAIRLNPPTVSLKGFSDVNRRLVTSSVATIAIYLVILLQFKISLVNLHNP